MSITKLKTGKDFRWFEVLVLSNHVSTPEKRTIHLKVFNNDYWPTDERYEKRVSRKLSKKNIFKLHGFTFDATDLLIPPVEFQ